MTPRIIFGKTEAATTPTNIKQDSPFSLPIQTLIKNYQKGLQHKKQNEISKIHVDEIASKVAFFYERIIKIVDWKEENLLRRNAIERFLKRKFITEISQINSLFNLTTSEVSEPLIHELIRGGHLPNDEIGQEKIPLVQKIIEKYLYIIKNSPLSNSSAFVFKKKVNFYNWILEIAACEIEDVLSPPIKENPLIESMTELMTERIRLNPSNTVSEEEKYLQVYIAVHRTLFDLDEAIISYHLLQKRYPFLVNPTEPALKDFTQNVLFVWEAINQDLSNPLAKNFFNVCERVDTAFTILGDILDNFQNASEEIFETISNKQTTKDLITEFYNKRFETLKARLLKLAIFSTLSVFVSNWFSFLVVEVPLAHLFYQGFSLPAAIFDFLIPSAVMFVLVSIIKPPPASNLDKVIKLVFQFVYADEEKEIYEINLTKKKRPLTNSVIFLLYIIACLATFYGIAWVFYKVSIPLTSVVLDTIGIALNVFAAMVIRNKAREITVEEKSNFGEFLLDILFLPIAEIGSWLASKWKEYNVVAVFFNVIIETPFLTFIDFIENWRQFLKERKAEIH